MVAKGTCTHEMPAARLHEHGFVLLHDATVHNCRVHAIMIVISTDGQECANGKLRYHVALVYWRHESRHMRVILIMTTAMASYVQMSVTLLTCRVAVMVACLIGTKAVSSCPAQMVQCSTCMSTAHRTGLKPPVCLIDANLLCTIELH